MLFHNENKIERDPLCSFQVFYIRLHFAKARLSQTIDDGIEIEVFYQLDYANDADMIYIKSCKYSLKSVYVTLMRSRKLSSYLLAIIGSGYVSLHSQHGKFYMGRK